jgi:C4-dicarboxylate transporter DctM subunit
MADLLVNGLGVLSALLLILNGLFISYEVFTRYVLNAPTTWVEEISIYNVVASTFLALAYVLLQKAHVGVDSVTGYLSPKAKLALEGITTVLAIVYCLVLDWEGAKMAYSAYSMSELSPTLLQVPMVIPELFIPLGALLLTGQLSRLLWSIVKRLASGGQEDAEPSGEETGSKVAARHGFGSGPVLIPGIFVLLLILSFVLLKTSIYVGLALLFFLLIFSGIPVAFALGLFGVFGFYFLFGGKQMLMQVPVMAYSALDSPITVALPLFVLASCVLRRGKIGIKIYRFVDTLVRHLPGGLGIASVLFCCLFASMTGSSVAVAATVSMIALPEMLSRGYSRTFCIGLLAAGGTLGILFPPSLPLMLYASMTGESLGALFTATLIPGLILSAMFCVYVAVVAGRDKNIKRDSRASLNEIFVAFGGAAGGLTTILIIMGGIYSGIFTPTEAGGIAAIYSIVLCCFIYRTLSLRELMHAALEAIKINSMIMFIVIGANITGQVILMAQIPANILAYIQAAAVPAWIVVLMINVFLIVLGAPLEAITILVITLPVLYPLVTGLGFSGLWFAVIMLINMELALISPPEGLNLFILQDLANASASEVTRGVLPYLAIIALFLVLISVVPGLATWLPAMMVK